MAAGVAGATGGAAAPPPSAGAAPPSLDQGARPATRRQIVIGALGGLTTGTALVAALLAMPAVQPAAATLDAIAPTLLSEAGQSLDPAAGRLALDEARQCKAPLAYVTISAAPGGPPSRVRIRSGGYQSPNILITDAPRRVAIPFPAPYPSGRGVISVEGAAFGLNVWLSPGRSFSALNGTVDIPVTWTPKNPC